MKSLSLVAVALFATTILANEPDRIYGEPTKAVDALPSSYVTSPTAWFSVDKDKTLSWFNVSEDLTSTNIVWQSTALPKGTPDAASTNAIWNAIARVTSNWGNYAPDGTANPEPDYMVYLNKPALVVGSGIHFETSGAYSVMVTDGAVAFANNGQDGSIRWGLNNTDYISIVQGGSVIVGARANSIDMDAQNEIVTIEYPYAGGDFPIIYFSTSLANDFTIVESPTWVDLGNGFAQVSISTANTQSGFFKATTSVQTSARFETPIPIKATGGVITDNVLDPIIFDSTIIIEQDGKKYRVPAQLVKE
ncbi:MAG: hypothetical protein II332_00555 [Kiritimatiellae bacterium]|nr:hypothetical protein [Kiritimatiellia bacterium]